MRKFAVIDIGSLKVKFLIAMIENGVVKIIRKDAKLTLLGKGIKSSSHRVHKKSLRNTIEAVSQFLTICDDEGVTKVKLIATESLRKAENLNEVNNEFKRTFGIIPQIISQEEEAKVFFKAMTKDFLPKEKIAVVDMGGGSIQVLLGSRENLDEIHFVPLGVYFLQQKFISDNRNEGKPSSEELRKLRTFIKTEIQASKIPANVNVPLIYGSSNVLDLFNMIDVNTIPSNYSSSHPIQINPQEIPKFLKVIEDMSYQQREKKYPLQWGYMWGIQMAFYNAYFLAKHLGSRVIIPSNVNIAEGYVLEMENCI